MCTASEVSPPSLIFIAYTVSDTKSRIKKHEHVLMMTHSACGLSMAVIEQRGHKDAGLNGKCVLIKHASSYIFIIQIPLVGRDVKGSH